MYSSLKADRKRQRSISERRFLYSVRPSSLYISTPVTRFLLHLPLYLTFFGRFPQGILRVVTDRGREREGERGEEMEEKAPVLEAVLKEAVDLVTNLSQRDVSLLWC